MPRPTRTRLASKGTRLRVYDLGTWRPGDMGVWPLRGCAAPSALVDLAAGGWFGYRTAENRLLGFFLAKITTIYINFFWATTRAVAQVARALYPPLKTIVELLESNSSW